MAFTLLKPTGIDLSQTFAFTGTVSGAGGGKIGQVKTVEINNNNVETGQGSDGVKTNSTSYVDVPGLTLSITPSATSSKILLLYHANVSNTDSEQDTNYASIRVLRDSTTVSESTRLNGYQYLAHDMWNMSVLDTPSSTSSLTYKIQILSGINTVYFSCPHHLNECGITLMEVLA
jgi:hypothetical protein